MSVTANLHDVSVVTFRSSDRALQFVKKNCDCTLAEAVSDIPVYLGATTSRSKTRTETAPGAPGVVQRLNKVSGSRLHS